MSEYNNNPVQEIEVEPQIEVLEPEVEPQIEVLEPEVEPQIEVLGPEVEPQIEAVEPNIESVAEPIFSVYWGTTYAMRKYVVANNPSAFKSGCPKQYKGSNPRPTPPAK